MIMVSIDDQYEYYKSILDKLNITNDNITANITSYIVDGCDPNNIYQNLEFLLEHNDNNFREFNCVSYFPYTNNDININLIFGYNDGCVATIQYNFENKTFSNSNLYKLYPIATSVEKILCVSNIHFICNCKLTSQLSYWRYIVNQEPECISVFKQRFDYPLDFTYMDKHIFVTTLNKNIALWSVEKKKFQTLFGHNSPVDNLNYICGLDILVSADLNQFMIWEHSKPTSKRLKLLYTSPYLNLQPRTILTIKHVENDLIAINVIHQTPETPISETTTGSLEIWSILRKKIISILLPQSGYFLSNCISYSPSNFFLLAMNNKRILHFWQYFAKKFDYINSHEIVQYSNNYIKYIYFLNNESILVAYCNGKINIYNI